MTEATEVKVKSSGLNLAAVVVLAVMFLLIALAVISMGVSVYGGTVEDSDANYDIRTAMSYIVNQARFFDSNGGVREAHINGVKALGLTKNIGGIRWTSYIYYYDGYVREITLAREGASVTLEGGRKIIAAEGMRVELTGDMICVSIEFEQGTQSVFISPECQEVS